MRLVALRFLYLNDRHHRMKKPVALCSLTARRSLPAKFFATVLAAALSACATPPPVPPENETLPESLRVPPSAILEQALTTTGDSIYRCMRALGGLQWRYQGSVATLVDSSGRHVGTVTPGGYFIGYDGSYVITRVDAQALVTTDGMPWVRLSARFNAQGHADGTSLFARTKYVQRVTTTGGLPTNLDCTIEGVYHYAPYSATYMLYR
jgi:Protein of unknown function (DUF3455)